MTKNPSKLAEVDYSSETLKLPIRVTIMWKVFKFGKMQSLDMVFMDEDGLKMLASIHHSMVDKFKHLLEEGKTYIMTNFAVLENDQQLRVSKLLYKLKFVRTTTIRECVLANIPLHAFSFTPFEKILFEKAPSNVLVDVIGQAFNVDDGRNVNVKRKNTVSPMNVISCTLWNDFANKFISYMEMNPASLVVIILTQANIKDTKSSLYPVGVQSYWTASKLFIDEHIKEINEFKASLAKWDSFVSKQYSQYSQSSQMTDDEKFIKNTPLKAMFELQQFKEANLCVTVGQIAKVYTDPGWFFYACTKYRVEVLVHDEEKHARFVLWDRKCMKLTGHTVNELIEQLRKDKIERIKTSMLVDSQSQEGSVGFVTPSKRLEASFLDGDDAINLSSGDLSMTKCHKQKFAK
ncbi:hypothetical protein L6164_013406 [Bauhinia variegata]|uniref:Uncharacterized protein n=1 Tax=Bauhinia variegata TaxID=167791 RepID=A0ACB9NFC5_BAUVA|nr:hypothetical protein L6164_013406 [Bauhinia variegata]